MDTLTSQEFLYRQVPVAYDGTGTLTSIKGNTVSFNQLLAMKTTMNYTNSNNNTLAYDSTTDLYKFTIRNVPSSNENDWAIVTFTFLANHKYFWLMYSSNANVGQQFGNGSVISSSKIVSYNTDTTLAYRAIVNSGTPTGTYYIRASVLDLALMGIDNLTTTAEVEQWLSSHIGDLPYYDYTQGTLIPFNGSGLKTTGKNLLENNITTQTVNGITYTVNEDKSVSLSGTATAYSYIDMPVNLENGNYIFSGTSVVGRLQIRSVSPDAFIKDIVGDTPYTISDQIKIRIRVAQGDTANDTVYPMIRLSSVQDATYEPYTSNTLSLPTLTYFPTGIKVVPDYANGGGIADELTPNKAITRVGSVDLGSLNWTKLATGNLCFSASLDGVVVGKTYSAVSCALYTTLNGIGRANLQEKQICQNSDNQVSNKALCVLDSTYADATAFKNAMSGVMLYYELATPTETDISLDLTYPVWNGGTEQILPINDSTPDTAPILCDIDYRGLIPVNATVDPSGSGTVSGTGNYRYHSEATLTATPSDEIYRFLRWEDENGDTVSTNATYTFEVGE